MEHEYYRAGSSVAVGNREYRLRMQRQQRLQRRRKRRIRAIIILGVLVALLLEAMVISNVLSTAGFPGMSKSSSNVDKNQWSLLLVNRDNEVPDDYQIEFTELLGGEKVDSRIYPALQEMFDATRNDGYSPIVVSGYRTTERQQELLDDKIDAFENEGYSPDEAEEAALAWVSKPGFSEHQIGIAVDINEKGEYADSTALYEWLEDNGYKYGFVLRYAEDKEQYTNCAYEPWHYRYVGKEAAEEMHAENVCLEEYLK